jgi:haloacetate dehalogenase
MIEDDPDDDAPVPDLFPGFEARWIDVEAGRFFARVGGPPDAPPLLLLHGFPETHAMWHRIAPALAATRRVVCLDLKGYGWSAAPRGDGGRVAYAKRTMAREAATVMETLGHVRFAIAGHDRGARVAYRLALDEPGRVERLALLDIVPTTVQWQRRAADPSVAPHWSFLAKAAPEPEETILRDPQGYFADLLGKWTAAGTLAAFDPAALDLYRANWAPPERVHAFCEDYRAGSETGPDRVQDDADLAAGRTIACPVLVLESTDYLDRDGKEGALAVWRRTFAPEATGARIRSGHFLAEENPAETLAALTPFLAPR